MRLKIIFLVFVLLIIAGIIPSVMAHCPLCTAAAGAGVGIARVYGVDDSIVGLFLGAFIVSTALWIDRTLKKKKIIFPLKSVFLIVASFLALAVPLYYAKIINNFNTVKIMPQIYSMTGLGVFGLGSFGVDKLLFGMIVGSLAVWGAFSLSDSIKKKRGKVLWDYQGLSFMLMTLVILTLIFWSLTK